MNVENRRLKIKCPFCHKKIFLTFNTTKCPVCKEGFDSDAVHQMFYDYESQLANSKAYRTGEKLQKAGNAMENAGNTMSQIGCALMTLTIGVIFILIIMSLLS